MPISNNITKETIQALRDGDHTAFERVFLFYFNKVKGFINGFVKSSSDAEELAEDVFVNLWQNREAIDPDRNFNTYVYVSARNATMNFLRKKYVRDSFVADQMKVGEEAYVQTEELIVAHEVDRLVDMVLMKMPAQRKAIYELNRREGLSNEEIAARLGLSKKTVENHMSLALGEIKNVVRTFVFLTF
jgi:RNA polymerase sigma-70 factor (ECF subfamily)